MLGMVHFEWETKSGKGKQWDTMCEVCRGSFLIHFFGGTKKQLSQIHVAIR